MSIEGKQVCKRTQKLKRLKRQKLELLQKEGVTESPMQRIR